LIDKVFKIEHIFLINNLIQLLARKAMRMTGFTPDEIATLKEAGFDGAVTQGYAPEFMRYELEDVGPLTIRCKSFITRYTPRDKIDVLQGIHVFITATNEDICYQRRRDKVTTLEEAVTALGFKFPPDFHKTPLE
jgi:hypothetical protein